MMLQNFLLNRVGQELAQTFVIQLKLPG